MAIKRYVYAENDADWLDTAAERLEQQGKGTNKISYTDFANSSVNMSITTGSYFEVGGSGFYVTGDTAVGGTPATGLCYILATGATATATIAWTTTAPVWRDDLQGYYATIASSVRAIGGCNYIANSYNNRWIYGQSRPIPKYFSCSLTGYSDNGGESEGNQIIWEGIGTVGIVYLSVNLTNGAVVTNVFSVANVSDNNIVVKLVSADEYSTAETDMATNTHSGDGALNDSSIASAVIDNSAKKYYVSCNRAISSGSASIYSVIITYEETG